MPKVFIKAIAIILCVPFLFIFTNSPQSVNASPQDDLNSLQQKQNALKKQINDIQQQIINAQINKQSLASQLGAFQGLLQSLQLQITQKETTINITQQNISELGSQKSQIQQKVIDLKAKSQNLKEMADQSTLQMFQLDRQPTISLIATKSLKDIFVSKAIENNARIKTREVYNELDQTQIELQAQQDIIDGNIKATQDLVNQVNDQKQQLIDSQNGLNSQINNKASQINQIQANINQKANTKEAISQEANQLNAQIQQIQFNLLSTRVSGSPVKRGEIIGREGNTGFVCAYSSSIGRSGDICGGFGYGWYLPKNEPCAASHVHFGLSLNGKSYVNPQPYIDNGTIGKPLDSYIISQGFGINSQVYGSGGHPAIDIDEYCGAPIRAATNGIVQYGCDNFSYNPAKYAIVYDQSTGIKTIYWHLRKGAGECPGK